MTRPRILVGYTGLYLISGDGQAVWARHIEFDWLAAELEREALTPSGRALVAELRARRARAAGEKYAAPRGGCQPPLEAHPGAGPAGATLPVYPAAKPDSGYERADDFTSREPAGTRLAASLLSGRPASHHWPAPPDLTSPQTPQPCTVESGETPPPRLPVRRDLGWLSCACVVASALVVIGALVLVVRRVLVG